MKRLIAAGLVVAGLTAGCGGGSSASSSSSALSDSRVVKDVETLFLYKTRPVQSVSWCAHQTGNQYVCQANMMDGSRVTINVTDDGKSVYESGVQ